MSNTQPQSMAEIASAALQQMATTALPLLREWANQNPSTEQYFCNAADCKGHSLKGTNLQFLEDSRLFSYNVNGNGFSCANAGTIEIEGKEIPLKVFWESLITLIPVCTGARLPTSNPFTKGEFVKMQFTTRVVEAESDQGGNGGRGGNSRRSGRRRGNNA